ncbi:hypothetical protein [Lancefieldella parvula]|uniref:hypothetical protein n=1 Tax=Lancefieldella parvula TaxID=1382 RepID=UPI00019D3794|nr:hypothetical protein [Lancefieldella parvula]
MDINGEPKDEIVQGAVGIIRDDNLSVPDNFLDDKVIFDSPKEKIASKIVILIRL